MSETSELSHTAEATRLEKENTTLRARVEELKRSIHWKLRKELVAQRDEAQRLLREAIAEDCLSQSGPPYGPERVHVLSERLVKCIKAHLAKGEYERGRVDGREEAEGMSE